MTVQQIITAAFRKLGMGRVPDDEDLADFLEALQSMLRYWASKKMLVFASTQETFNTVGGTASYSWGSGGVITTARPSQIVDMFIRDSGNLDRPVGFLYETEYAAISDKTTRGRSDSYFYKTSFPLAYVYLLPVPDIAEVVHVSSIKPWTEASSFAALGNTISFPVEYEAAIIHNLAMWVASEYGVIPSAIVKKIAEDTLYTIMSHNAANQITPVVLNFFSGVGSYNINER
jgi:hypothetical protein